MKPYLIILFALTVICLFSEEALSRNAIALEWQDHYENSLSDDKLRKAKQSICLLCHTKPSGGEPWNAYGWMLRSKNVLDDPKKAFKAVEQINSDSDKDGQSNIFEISKGSQPGWNKNEQNWSYYKNGKKEFASPPKGLKFLD